ncbi:MAG: glycosidase [Dehalococcoidia bacterium]|nr:MAG: glycosidase [Dehalococcoidia bacterium]
MENTLKKEAFENIESRYQSSLEEPLSQARGIGKADIVIGIPFYNEAETLPHVIKTSLDGLKEFYPDSRAVLVAAGSPLGARALELINSSHMDHISDRIAFIFRDKLLNGKGWSIRAITDIARQLGADLAILEADLRSRSENGETVGLSPEWIQSLLDPIRNGDADVVLSRFNRHYLEAPVSALTYPLLATIYECPIRRLTGGQWGISHRLLDTYLEKKQHAWQAEISGYGVDSWLALTAIRSNATIGEVNLGIKLHRPLVAKGEIVLRQVANVFFDRIVADHEWWIKRARSHHLPVLKNLPLFGIPKEQQGEAVKVIPAVQMAKFRQGFNTYHWLYERVLPADRYRQLEELAEGTGDYPIMPRDLWAEAAYSFILAYAFSSEFRKGDLLSSLIPLYNAFMGGLSEQMQWLENELTTLPSKERMKVLYSYSEMLYTELVYEFIQQRDEFLAKWQAMAEVAKPPVPLVTYREFIPGVPLVVPTEIVTSDGRTVSANGIYDSVFTRYKAQFENFVDKKLEMPRDANSYQITLAIKDFVRSVEEHIFPDSDLSTVEGTQRFVQAIFDNFPHGETFTLTPQTVESLLERYPPLTLLTKFGKHNLKELFSEYDPHDILALSGWVEGPAYLDRLLEIIAVEAVPEHFSHSPIQFLVYDHEELPSLVELRGASTLDKLSGRIVVCNLHKGMGGEFPKLRYFTTIAKDIVEAERFGHIWERFAGDYRDFGRRIINSIKGHWSREPLSAHNIFEGGNHRLLVDRIRVMADIISSKDYGKPEEIAFAESLRDIADSYNISMVYPDGRFVTSSVWSWASYSYKGGRASPTPLSIHVERDWISQEFLLEYYKSIGGTESEIERKVIELIGQGKEWMDMAPILLGTTDEAQEIIPEASSVFSPEPPQAGSLIRFNANPILRPIQDHSWESRYVLNPGSIRLEGKVYLVYRAFGEEQISRLGLAVSEDGFYFSERLNTPIFEPVNEVERKGCEDPRLILIRDRIYMTYTAYSGTIAQIALASINVEDFLKYRWERWRRHGLVFPGFTDKDAALFPVKFNGEYAMLHRVDPHIWITFSRSLKCPWSRAKHRILIGATAGMMWDGLKIGAGAQPIRTKYGWLLVTHGVDFSKVYRLGVILLALDDPSKLIYRSPNFVLEPECEWEVGKAEECWVSNVVFTCGVVNRDDGRDILSADDEIIIYFGAADSVICVATATIGTLIPQGIRQHID